MFECTCCSWYNVIGIYLLLDTKLCQINILRSLCYIGPRQPSKLALGPPYGLRPLLFIFLDHDVKCQGLNYSWQRKIFLVNIINTFWCDFSNGLHCHLIWTAAPNSMKIVVHKIL